LEYFPSHNPRPFIPYISPTPLLLTITLNDTLTPTEFGLSAFQEAKEPKELQLIPGDHFEVYGGPTFERNVTTQTAFIKKWLL